MSTTWAPLRHRDFGLLVAGSATSTLGNAIAPVALAFAVLDLGGTATDLGLVVAAFALAEVATTLLGGVLGDRMSRQLLMQGSEAASAVVQALTAAALIADAASIWLLTLSGVAVGCLSSLSRPSSQAITRATVPAAELGSAIALRSTSQNAAAIVGYSVGGLLVAGAGPGWAIAADAATYLVAAAAYALLRVPHEARAAGGGSMLADIGEGWREVRRHGWLVLLIAQALLYHLFYGGAQGVLGPIVVRDRFSTQAWGWAMSALMVGFLAGSLLSLRWRPLHGLRVGTAWLALTALFPLAMAVAHQVPVLLAGAFLHGLGLMVFSVNWDVSIQQQVDPDKLARVHSFDTVGSFVARPLGLALTGPVAAAVGLTGWLVVVGAVIGGSSLLATLSGDVRRLRRTDVVAPEASPAG